MDGNRALRRVGWVLAALGCLTSALPGQEAVFREGQAALEAGDLPEAEAAFRRVLAEEPRSLPARANLGVVYMRRKMWARALSEFRRAELLAPGNPGVEINIGLALFHQADYAGAMPAFQAVLDKDPSSLQASYLLGVCRFAMGQYAEAADQLGPLWSQENGNMAYLYVLAFSAGKAGKADLERQALERMYQAGNNTAEYHLFLGRAWLLRQRDEDALKELLEAARLNPKLPAVHNSLGGVYASLGKLAEAKEEFEADAVIDPELASNEEQLGEICLRLGRPDDAEKHFRRATQLDSRSARSFLELGKIEKGKGSDAAALHYLDEAIKLDSQSASAHYLRGQVLAKLNRQREAKAELNASARLRQSTRDKLEEQVSRQPNMDPRTALP